LFIGARIVKRAPATSSLKKAVVVMSDGSSSKGYLNPGKIGRVETLDLLTASGEHQEIAPADVRGIYFVNDLNTPYELERKAFLSRPKLDGLWVRLRFKNGETLEGVVPNDLLALLDVGVQITPPDFQGNTQRIFIPREALAELKVLGVVGVARRKAVAAAAADQPTLFSEED
jgi:hypothetical protein